MSAVHRTPGNRVHNLNYHFVWCPKFRRKVLVGDVATRCEALIRQKCQDIKAEIIAVEIMPDHVHLFVACTPDPSPSYIVNQVKGFTSRLLRQEFPHLLKMPSLWSRSWYVGSIGHASDSVVRAYIEAQKGK